MPGRVISLRICLSLASLLLLIATLFPISQPPVNAETHMRGTVVRKSPSFTKPASVEIEEDEGDDAPHLLAATYYSLKDDLRARLLLNNKSPHALEVQPALFNLSGVRLDVPAVTVGGNSFREIDLREMTGGRAEFAEGSLQVFYRGHDLALGAQVYLTDVARSLVFEEKLAELAEQFSSSRLEGVWWLPSHGGEMRLVLSNTTDASLSVTASVEGSAPPQHDPATLMLAPHETRVVDILRDLVGDRGGRLAQVGGVSLRHSGAGGALLARLLIREAERGYSSWARFTDPSKGKSSKYQGAGLRLGTVGGERLTPVVVARNVGSTETTISGRIPYTLDDGSTGAFAIPDLRLAPGEAGTVNVTGALAREHIERDVATAGLEFEYTGTPGSVIMSAQSISPSRTQVFQVPLWDIVAQRSSTGGYPWKAEGDASTIIYIKNVTDRAQEYTWQLRHAGGTYSLGLRTIAAHQTEAIDIRALRDEQVPDQQGRTIPRDATSGQVHWSLQGGGNLTLIGRAEQVDAVGGISSSYACQNCCPDSFLRGFTRHDSFTGFPGDESLCEAMQQNEDCYGTLLEPFHVSAIWSSSDTSVMSLNPGGWAQAEAPGTATVSAFWRAFIYTDGGSSGCESGLLHPSVETLCEILPLQANRGRIQAQGSNPRVEVSIPWSQEDVPSKATALNWLDGVWNKLTSSQQRDRQRAYEDARRFILNAPQDGYEAYPFKISRSFRDPSRRDPDARIDIEIITGRAFEGPF
jgi:hypothetical protein